MYNCYDDESPMSGPVERCSVSRCNRKVATVDGNGNPICSTHHTKRIAAIRIASDSGIKRGTCHPGDVCDGWCVEYA